MRDRGWLRRSKVRGAGIAAALTLAAACATVGGPAQASTDRGSSAGKRCTHLFIVGRGYTRPGRVYNLSCARAQSYSARLPTGWSGAQRNDGKAEHALIYRSRDANRVMRAIRPGGATANTRILGKRPLMIISGSQGA